MAEKAPAGLGLRQRVFLAQAMNFSALKHLRDRPLCSFRDTICKA
jgi:hypothetical protein